ncbi:hypothetical protein FOA52_008203 [Chlamydomonas sp. UWO 241]|nr:hypothetical protein FOA52_008203 [Chlamydomonas sp. UWO 241]
MPLEVTVGDVSGFWVTAGSAGAVVGGVVAATVGGALVVSRAIDAEEQRLVDPAALAEAQAEERAEAAKGRTRLRPEDVMAAQAAGKKSSE